MMMMNLKSGLFAWLLTILTIYASPIDAQPSPSGFIIKGSLHFGHVPVGASESRVVSICQEHALGAPEFEELAPYVEYARDEFSWSDYWAKNDLNSIIDDIYAYFLKEDSAERLSFQQLEKAFKVEVLGSREFPPEQQALMCQDVKVTFSPLNSQTTPYRSYGRRAGWYHSTACIDWKKDVDCTDLSGVLYLSQYRLGDLLPVYAIGVSQQEWAEQIATGRWRFAGSPFYEPARSIRSTPFKQGLAVTEDRLHYGRNSPLSSRINGEALIRSVVIEKNQIQDETLTTTASGNKLRVQLASGSDKLLAATTRAGEFILMNEHGERLDELSLERTQKRYYKKLSFDASGQCLVGFDSKGMQPVRVDDKAALALQPYKTWISLIPEYGQNSFLMGSAFSSNNRLALLRSGSSQSDKGTLSSTLHLCDWNSNSCAPENCHNMPTPDGHVLIDMVAGADRQEFLAVSCLEPANTSSKSQDCQLMFWPLTELDINTRPRVIKLNKSMFGWLTSLFYSEQGNVVLAPEFNDAYMEIWSVDQQSGTLNITGQLKYGDSKQSSVYFHNPPEEFAISSDQEHLYLINAENILYFDRLTPAPGPFVALPKTICPGTNGCP